VRSATPSRRWQTQFLPQASELFDKRCPQGHALVLWEERHVDRVERDALHSVGVIALMPDENAEFVGQRRPKQGWVVGVDGHQDSGLVERPEWVVGKAGHHTSADVARRGELEWDAIPHQTLHQPGIVHGTDSMPNP